MAKKMLYSVYDAKVKYFHPPMFMMNRGEALRSWEEIANDESSTICRHPNDFDLFELGEFDDQTGKIVMHPSPESLGLAIQFRRAVQAQAQPSLFKNANK